MIQTYSLQKVMFPEDKYLKPEYHNLPRCPIFMSASFLTENPQANEAKKALVLI